MDLTKEGLDRHGGLTKAAMGSATASIGRVATAAASDACTRLHCRPKIPLAGQRAGLDAPIGRHYCYFFMSLLLSATTA